jgi:hypothetical protein
MQYLYIDWIVGHIVFNSYKPMVKSIDQTGNDFIEPTTW